MFKTGIDSKTIQIKQETTILPGGGDVERYHIMTVNTTSI